MNRLIIIVALFATAGCKTAPTGGAGGRLPYQVPAPPPDMAKVPAADSSPVRVIFIRPEARNAPNLR